MKETIRTALEANKESGLLTNAVRTKYIFVFRCQFAGNKKKANKHFDNMI